MKFYEYIKDNDRRILKVLGFSVMEYRSDYETGERYQIFFKGLFSTVKVNDKYSEGSKKDIRFLGCSITKRIEKDNYRDYYFLNKKYYSVYLVDEFKKRYIKYFDKKYDDIYILRGNSGEAYLTLTYIINALIKRNKSKSPLLVATKKYHEDMIKMICPHVPYIKILNLKMNICDFSFSVDNFRFFMLYTHKHFLEVDREIKTSKIGEYHYFKSILKYVNMSENELEMNKAQVLSEAEKSALEKASEIGLNIENFVFIAPEADSCELYDDNFWHSLIKGFQDKGYDVFINLVKNDVRLDSVADYKVCDLTYSEAFALAKRAKKIVSLRSGLTEFLMQTNVCTDVLYTRFRGRGSVMGISANQVIAGYSLCKLPFADNFKIREFDASELTSDTLEMFLSVNIER